jgi:multidrug efflux pump subunit AcrA (membrane-fusion protein)
LDANRKSRQKKHVTIRIVICALIVAIGWAGMSGLASLKKPPAEAATDERAIKVQVTTAQPGDYPVTITGFGETRALTVVTIAPEVSGRVVYTHPALRAGEIIPSGEVLFRIDPADYQARLEEAKAGVTQWRHTVARLNKQFEIDVQRLKTLQRSAELAKTEFERVERLFASDRVGTRSGVDQAERVYNSALDLADQMAQAVSLYPLQIREAESSLASAGARLSMAETNLARCTRSAPFDARVKTVSLETGQFVSPGQQVLSLADDSVLEIQVPLSSGDARDWLQFDPVSRDQLTTAWFKGLRPVACRIRWTEDKDGPDWAGTLNRVIRFDQQTRTLTVAVRVTAASATDRRIQKMPLVEGMFCVVEIPGRTMRNVFKLPRQAVSFENKVYLANANGRLETVTVTVQRAEGESVYVIQGLSPGDTVITTRLIDPLENALVEIAAVEPAREPAS